ncbi:TetR/AcrR family transcriptional regulator [Vibrio sp. JC009]|uniref:TetR/AcrR family transcriptional regulator n=1 Tax=Vibrio sp. JC009 TaxID=2912314 RepID=UPI0023B1AF84|nr:TetR/AcrR family transcriptional regulator [Vibrio sp. JC009]WED20839.1 TetR/AcrR family transcriptional regulator [Vibrio sp. JC009]
MVKKTRSELKREAIVEAAKLAFIESGVQGTSMDAISEKAQVSKRTVYNHFETKEALVMHIINELWRKAIMQIDVKYSAEKPLHEQLSQLLLIEAQLISSSENIELSRVAFGHFFYNPDALKKEMVKYSARETALYRWLEAAVADGKLKPMDFEFANDQLHHMLKGACFWPLLLDMGCKPEEENLQRLANESAAMFLSYYQK